MIKIILVDDQELSILNMRTAVESRSDFYVVGTAMSGADFFELLKTVEADIVLLDIMMPGMNGAEVARRLKAERPEMKILAVSSENSMKIVEEMLDIGIEGFISKRYASKEEYANAILSIMEGINFYGKDISHVLNKLYVSIKKTIELTDEFTEQEKRIIELCRDCLPGKLIADRLNISLRTVDTHKRNLFKKLGLNSTAEMVKCAIKNGIIRAE